MNSLGRTVVLAASLVLLQPGRADAAAIAQHVVPDSVLEAMRKGGLVFVFRHAHTDRSKMDDQNFAMGDRSTQRNLSELGVAQSKSIGTALSAMNIRVGQVFASPMFRTRETAEFEFGRSDTTELLRTKRTSNDALALLTAAPDSGVSRVLVTHNAYIMHHFTKVGHGEIAEGEVIVVRPLGADGYRVLGRVKADDWEHLKSHRH